MVDDIKSFVPTLVIGVGGTGLEVITRIRRLIVESYGSLANFPLISFLHIDTEQNYKIKDPNMAGPALEAMEKFWSEVKLINAQAIVQQKNNYSWYHEWLPPELEPQQLVSQQGAGQIRACGRFSFFYNRNNIQQKCQDARNRISKDYDVTIEGQTFPVQPKLNIFVVASISGGTGSGMLIDLGYSLKEWFQGENGLEITAIVPSPDAFEGVGAGLRLKENGYAALMELNYFYDVNTEYKVQFGPHATDQITNNFPPYDFMYIVETQNQLMTVDIDQIREMMAQNIFLDLVSDYSSYKRTVRDNIRSQITAVNDQPLINRNNQNQPIGRSYPRNFYSFGISTIEIPIYPIRKYLSSRLTSELYQWWLKKEVRLPSDMAVEVDKELKQLELLPGEIIKKIVMSADGLGLAKKVEEFIVSLEDEIRRGHFLECTAQLPNIFAKEEGKILEFNKYLENRVNKFKRDNLRDDQINQGEYIKRMYINQETLFSKAKKKLENKVCDYLLNNHYGSQYLIKFLKEVTDKFNREITLLETEASDKTWETEEDDKLAKYNKNCSIIQELRNRWLATKESDMKGHCDEALKALKDSWKAGIQRKSRQITAETLRDLVKSVEDLEIRLNRWIQKFNDSLTKYQDLAKQQENKVNSLEFLGLKLFEGSGLKELYSDFCVVKSGKDVLFKQLTDDLIKNTNESNFWTQSKYQNQKFRLFDIEKLDQIQYPQFEQFVAKITQKSIKDAPAHSKLAQDLDACNLFMKLYPDPGVQKHQIQLLFNKSKPLVRLDETIPQGRFQYIKVHQAGIVGGEKTTEPVAQKVVELLEKFFTQTDAIAPLSNRERHKILAVHEVGGFSLRCLAGIGILRQEYQRWRGERIRAERASLQGQQAQQNLPIPVHLQKDIVFWDLVPPDPTLEELVLVSRAFGLLQEEINQNTQKSVIRYRKKTPLGEDTITLASTWEDVIQILELPDCQPDRTEIEGQLEKVLENAQTQPQKQQLRKQLEDFLNERLQTVYRKIGTHDPLYLRERTIIQEFIIAHKLGTNINPTPPQLTATTDHKLGSSVSDQPQPPSKGSPEAEYEEYLTELSSSRLREEDLKILAKNKANQLNLSQEVSDRILKRFLTS